MVAITVTTIAALPSAVAPMPVVAAAAVVVLQVERIQQETGVAAARLRHHRWLLLQHAFPKTGTAAARLRHHRWLLLQHAFPKIHRVRRRSQRLAKVAAARTATPEAKVAVAISEAVATALAAAAVIVATAVAAPAATAVAAFRESLAVRVQS